MNNVVELRRDPIKTFARAYAKAKRIPQTEAGAALYLEQFGKGLCGGLEAMLSRALKVQRDMANLATMPPFRENRITEVARNG